MGVSYGTIVFFTAGPVIPEPVSVPEVAARQVVNWPHVWAYIGLSFGLAWLIDLVLYLNGGLKHPGAALMLQFQMLMPAFAALLLGVFFFKEVWSTTRPTEPPRAGSSTIIS